MDFIEKARIKFNHWMKHNEDHQEEYEKFANQLEEAGKKKSAEHVRKMKELTVQINDCLKKALAALD